MFGGLNAWLDGKKTLIGGIAGVLTALGAFLLALQDGFQINDLTILGAGLAGAFAILGLGGKAEKILAALKALGK